MVQWIIILSVEATVWGSYSFVTFMSQKDPSFFEFMLMLIFAYFSYLLLIHFKVIKKFALISALIGLCIYVLFGYS